MPQYSKTEQDVLDVHSLFLQAYADRNIDLRFSVVADDVTFIGTGLYEKATNKEEYREINEKGIEQYPDPLEIELLAVRVKVLDTIAWVESEIIWKHTIRNKRYEDLIRNTVILKKEKEKWWVIHVHGSNPDYRFGEGEFMLNENTVQRNKELEQQVYERTLQLNKSLQELKAMQTQLIQAEKMATLGELMAGISHEIQNPLNFVNNFSEVNKDLITELKEEVNAGNKEEALTIADTLRENAEKIAWHGKRADAIVRGMLQHSRTTTQKQPTDIDTLVEECVRLSYYELKSRNENFNASFQTHFDSSIEAIEVAAQDIGRVLLNICKNAFYAVNEKKKQLNGTFEPLVEVSTKKMQDGVEITVKDNGTGIPQNVLDKIYQPFFTTKPRGEGTGLGLSLSYDIIKKGHGGEMKVETKEGEGTAFTILIPQEKSKKA